MNALLRRQGVVTDGGKDQKQFELVQNKWGTRVNFFRRTSHLSSELN